MRKRRNVDNLGHGDACTVNGADSRLTAVARTLHVGFHLAQAQVIGNLGAILRGHLGGIGSVLFRATESHLAGRRPRNNLSLTIGEAHNDVVERRMNVELPDAVDLDHSLLCCDCLLCHTLKLFSSFLFVSNSFLAALAGAGVVLGALTAHGKAVAVTDAAVATDVHQSLDVHLDGRTELALDLVLLVDEVTDECHLLVVPVSDLDVVVDTALVKDLPRAAAADTVNVGEAYLTTFVVR